METDVILDATVSRLESFVPGGPCHHWLDMDHATSRDARPNTGQQQFRLTLEPEDVSTTAVPARRAVTCRPHGVATRTPRLSRCHHVKFSSAYSGSAG